MSDQETKFEQWAKRYGVSNLVDAMRRLGPDYAVTYSAIYQWLRGDHEPRPRKIRALAELSNGTITVQDIHDHFALKAVARNSSPVLAGVNG